MPSIQPKQSAWSTDSGHVMLGLPLPFLWKPTSSSRSVSWCRSSQARKSSGVAKKVGFIGCEHRIGRVRQRVVTIGVYEWDLDSFLHALREAGVRRLIDVR